MKLDLKLGMAKEGRVFVHEARGAHTAVFGVKLDANALPVGFEGGEASVAKPQTARGIMHYARQRGANRA
jgi:hypothetical protein